MSLEYSVTDNTIGGQVIDPTPLVMDAVTAAAPSSSACQNENESGVHSTANLEVSMDTDAKGMNALPNKKALKRPLSPLWVKYSDYVSTDEESESIETEIPSSSTPMDIRMDVAAMDKAVIEPSVGNVDDVDDIDERVKLVAVSRSKVTPDNADAKVGSSGQVTNGVRVTPVYERNTVGGGPQFYRRFSCLPYSALTRGHSLPWNPMLCGDSSLDEDRIGKNFLGARRAFLDSLSDRNRRQSDIDRACLSITDEVPTASMTKIGDFATESMSSFESIDDLSSIENILNNVRTSLPMSSIDDHCKTLNSSVNVETQSVDDNANSNGMDIDDIVAINGNDCINNGTIPNGTDVSNEINFDNDLMHQLSALNIPNDHKDFAGRPKKVGQKSADNDDDDDIFSEDDDFNVSDHDSFSEEFESDFEDEPDSDAPFGVVDETLSVDVVPRWEGAPRTGGQESSESDDDTTSHTFSDKSEVRDISAKNDE